MIRLKKIVFIVITDCQVLANPANESGILLHSPVSACSMYNANHEDRG